MIKRFSYFLRSGSAVSPPKSIYASSITTTLSGFVIRILSISEREIVRPVGALGFAITMFVPKFS